LYRFNDLWQYNPSTGNWTWVSGTNTGNPAGVYGTKGVASATNAPGGRESAATWTDSAGNLWLFGGFGLDSVFGEGVLNDLWKFSPSTGMWTWVAGSDRQLAVGSYGTLGTASASNIPGSRTGAVAWTDSAGGFWLFGGDGCDSAGCGIPGQPSFVQSLNDLWKYDATGGTWTWVSGSNLANHVSVYGTRGVAAAGNVPNGRSGAVGWIDCSNNLWLFGGQDAYLDSFGFFVSDGSQNDLWEYSSSTGLWTWVSGSNSFAAFGVYGTEGAASTSNVPGARIYASSWMDSGGHLWLFGGFGVDSTNAMGYLNDLWQFNPGAGTWEWVSGADTVNAVGVYGTQGTASATNVPTARYGADSWIDATGNLWLFGGTGNQPPDGTTPYFNDLWEYTPAPSAATGQVCPTACKHDDDAEDDDDRGDRDHGDHDHGDHSKDERDHGERHMVDGHMPDGHMANGHMADGHKDDGHEDDGHQGDHEHKHDHKHHSHDCDDSDDTGHKKDDDGDHKKDSEGRD
jgi:N-acetylneuraminic acid mutarotase